MYVRTPKKYQGTQRRSILSCRRVLFWIIALVIIGAGIVIFQNRETLQPLVSEAMDDLVDRVEQGVATVTAPTATPTPDPVDKIVLGDTYWDNGAVSEAVNTYETIVGALPNDVSLFERIIVGSIVSGREQEGLEYADEIVNADPFSSEAWGVRSWILAYNDQLSEAIISGLHALELNPSNTRAKAFLAEAYLNNEQVERALQLANEVLEDDPGSIEGYRIRGRINRYGLFDFDAALEDFRTGYDLALNSSPVLAFIMALNISDMQMVQEEYDAAIDTLEEILELNPQNPLALYRLADVYNRGIGDPNQAIKYLNRCVQDNPQNSDCFYLLGRAQYRLEEYNTAAESFARAIDLGSTNPFHYYWAGWSQINLGNCARAMTFLDPGYEVALSGTNEVIIGDIETVILNCDPNFRPRSVTEPDA